MNSVLITYGLCQNIFLSLILLKSGSRYLLPHEEQVGLDAAFCLTRFPHKVRSVLFMIELRQIKTVSLRKLSVQQF